jgi:hypothetical protein
MHLGVQRLVGVRCTSAANKWNNEMIENTKEREIPSDLTQDWKKGMMWNYGMVKCAVGGFCFFFISNFLIYSIFWGWQCWVICLFMGVLGAVVAADEYKKEMKTND